MNPSAVATGLPSVTSWYMNPYFMASFGAVVALGFVIFALAYFVFVRLKIAQPTISSEASCATCGLTGDMITRLIPCKDHSGLVADIDGIKRWIRSHEEDYRRLAQRCDAFMDKWGTR